MTTDATTMADPRAVDVHAWEGYGPPPDVALEAVLWRIDSKGFDQTSSPTGFVARYVPYLNASTIARLLDGWVGPLNWRDIYQDGTLAGKPVLWCHLEIRSPQPAVGFMQNVDSWVRKSDAGVAPSDQGTRGRGDGLSEKGMVSDAFKRAACLKWGAGRNVYDLPTVWGPVHCRGNDPDKPVAPAGVEAHLIAALRAKGLQVDAARTEAETGTDFSPDAAPPGPAEPAHACPHCGSPVLDMRKEHEADEKHKKPAWRCRNQQCDGGDARKDVRRGQTPNWPWASWDTKFFTPPAGELERANWMAKMRLLRGAGGAETLAVDAWAQAAAELGRTVADILEVPELAAVEARAVEIMTGLIVENATIQRGTERPEDLPEGKGEPPEDHEEPSNVAAIVDEGRVAGYGPDEQPF